MTKEVEVMTKMYELQTEMTEIFIKYFRDQNTAALTKSIDMLQTLLIQMRAAATSS